MNSTNKNSNEISTKFLAGLTAFQKGHIGIAKSILEDLLRVEPNHSDALHLSGVILGHLKLTKKGIDFLQKAVKLDARNAELHSNLGNLLTDDRQYDSAIEHFNLAIKLDPKNFVIYSNLGRALQNANRHQEALASYKKAIELQPNYAEAFFNRGYLLHQLNKFSDAVADYDKAIHINSNYAEAHNNRGTSLFELNRLEDALNSYNKAIELRNNYFIAYNNRGRVLKELCKTEDALLSYEKAIEFNNSYFEAYNNRGIVLHDMRQLNSSLRSYDYAIKLAPFYAEAYSNRGLLLKDLNRFNEALADFNKAIDLKPNLAEAHNNRGLLLKLIGSLSESLACYEKVFHLNPNFPLIKGELLHSMMNVCHWDSLPNLFASIIHDINNNKLATDPFGFQGVCDDAQLLQKVAILYSNSKFPARPALLKKYLKNKRIKLCYLCGEFRDHATSILMVHLWELHDKNKFEIIALDNGWDDGSEIRKRIEKSFDKLVDISKMSDTEVVQFICNENIDILVNLNCFFGLQRNSVFAYKPAPIQVNYLGFPGTLGSNYIDYIIADEVVIPESDKEFYSEKIAYLPNCYQANDRLRVISNKIFSKKELGLPEKGFVFCCFNNNYKITPNTFDSWIRILTASEGSVLWLLEGSSAVSLNLRKEAQARGLDPNRLVFAKRVALSEHLGRHAAADLFLDTLPYNAHTTASDALWAGLPILTHIGKSFAGRVTASLLNAIELPDLITYSQEQYESTAIDLAKNPHKLKFIKDKLERNRLTTALFDSARFTKNIEAAYTHMYDRHNAELPIEHFRINE